MAIYITPLTTTTATEQTVTDPTHLTDTCRPRPVDLRTQNDVVTVYANTGNTYTVENDDTTGEYAFAYIDVPAGTTYSLTSAADAQAKEQALAVNTAQRIFDGTLVPGDVWWATEGGIVITDEDDAPISFD